MTRMSALRFIVLLWLVLTAQPALALLDAGALVMPGVSTTRDALSFLRFSNSDGVPIR